MEAREYVLDLEQTTLAATLFGVQVRTHRWIPKGLVVATDRQGNVVGVIKTGEA